LQYFLIESRPAADEVLKSIGEAEHAYIKFLSANDLGLTGAHQSGIYLSKDSYKFFMEQPGKNGENFEKNVRIRWHDVITDSCFKWYGSGSRSEYRLTKTRDFFRGREELYTGSLFILCQMKDGQLYAWVLNDDETVDAVFNFTGLSPSETNRLIQFDLDERLRPSAETLLEKYGSVFPETDTIARDTWNIFENLYGGKTDPDRMIVDLIRIEYAVFRYLEKEIYRPFLGKPFASVEALMTVSLEINNRRKSRAGRSLELHLRYIFDTFGVEYSPGAVSEMKKRPDFIFPSEEAYRDENFPSEKLFTLGAKTTCKDRWRQVISEADRVKDKYLFTLQQGFTSSQLIEMKAAGVIPVIPAEFHEKCRSDDRGMLMTLSEFIEMVTKANGKQASLFP